MRPRKQFGRGNFPRERRDNREEKIIEWIPKTQLGKEVMSGKVTSLHDIFASGRKIKEPEIVDKLVHNLQTDII